MRAFALLLVALLFACAGIDRAHAGACTGDAQTTACDQGAAYAQALSWSGGAAACVQYVGSGATAGAVTANHVSFGGGKGQYAPQVMCFLGGNPQSERGGPVVAYSGTCSSRNGDGDGPSSGGNAILVGGGSACFNGCSYSSTLGEGSSRWSFSAGQTITYSVGSNFNPTGAVCDSSGGEAPTGQNEYCATVSNLTQCLQNDGRHCAVSSTGKRFCWTPKETGTKVSGNEAVTKAPEGAGINPPPAPPKNNGQWQESGTGTASVTAGGVTNNYNISNFTSSYGPEGGGGGAEGEGGGDEGNGDEQPGWTKGNEPGREGEGEGEVDEPTRFGLGISPSMLDDTNIFGGESCPQFPAFQIMGVTVNPTADLPQWCTLVSIMRAVVLIMGAYLAARILMGGL